MRYVSAVGKEKTHESLHDGHDFIRFIQKTGSLRSSGAETRRISAELRGDRAFLRHDRSNPSATLIRHVHKKSYMLLICSFCFPTGLRTP